MKYAEIFNVLRVTTSFGQDTELKNNVFPKRALKRLRQYEDTGLSPFEISQMADTIESLRKRVRESEDW